MVSKMASYIRACDSTAYTIKVNRVNRITWEKWNHNYVTTAATTTGQYYFARNGVEATSSASTSIVWSDWNNYQPVTMTSNIEINDYTWEKWVIGNDGLSVRPLRRRELTEEERAARAAAEERRAQERAELETAMAAAQERALTLLLSALDEEQAAEYTEHKRFHVTATSGRRYCIKHGRQHNVFLVDGEGRAVREYCGHVGESVPNEDNILAQKLLLEADEAEFIRVANARNMAPTPV